MKNTNKASAAVMSVLAMCMAGLAQSAAAQCSANFSDYQIEIFSSTTPVDPAADGEATFYPNIASGYKVLGGGAVIDTLSGDAFITASYPDVDPGASVPVGWTVASKHIGNGTEARITGYAIGIKAKGAGVVTPVSYSAAGKPSAPNADPMADASGANNVFPGRDCVLTGGGANDAWTSLGNMLTANYPAGTNTWLAFGRSHGGDDASVMTAYTVCLK